MKKFLLFAALAASFAANAAITDILTFKYEDKEIANGDKVVINEKTALGLEGNVYVYAKGSDVVVSAFMEYDGLPTAEQYASEGMEVWGLPQLCACAIGGMGNCYGSTDATNIAGTDKLTIYTTGTEYQFHVMFPPEGEYKSHFKVRTVLNSDPSQEFIFYVDFEQEGTGVEGLVETAAPAEYYNMQGVRVANPQQGGLYIVKQGNKVSKNILK